MLIPDRRAGAENSRRKLLTNLVKDRSLKPSRHTVFLHHKRCAVRDFCEPCAFLSINRVIEHVCAVRLSDSRH